MKWEQMKATVPQKYHAEVISRSEACAARFVNPNMPMPNVDCAWPAIWREIQKRDGLSAVDRVDRDVSSLLWLIGIPVIVLLVNSMGGTGR